MDAQQWQEAKNLLKQIASADPNYRETQQRLERVKSELFKLLPKTKIGKDGKEMILIPTGEFTMGDDATNAPAHQVYLDAFYISRYPVTNAEYKKYVDATKHTTPRYWSGGKIPQGKENHPVVQVTWIDAVEYCKWANVRLPTEAEWEKAASWDEEKQEKRIYPWGKDFDVSKCNTHESKIRDTTPVNQYSPQGDSAYGISDMSGNTWEWCSDWYVEDYYKNSPKQNPLSPEKGIEHVLRGGPCHYTQDSTRCAYRDLFDPISPNFKYGFRVAEPLPRS